MDPVYLFLTSYPFSSLASPLMRFLSLTQEVFYSRDIYEEFVLVSVLNVFARCYFFLDRRVE